MPLNITLLNSSSPWATTIDDLRALHESPHTDAVTTRTSLHKGFAHSDTVHQHLFFGNDSLATSAPTSAAGLSSLNTLGYSPVPLQSYIDMIRTIVTEARDQGRKQKPFLVSVTGSAEDVSAAYEIIVSAAAELKAPLHMEVNLSCPNIAGKPPPAYDRGMLMEYLVAVGETKATLKGTGVDVLVGIKTPPYTYSGQFDGLVGALLEASQAFGGKCPVDFITATNTLGSSLILSNDGTPQLSSEAGSGIGGMAGASLHPLSLGNVAAIRKLLDQREELKGIEIIGVGGVSDGDGYRRMRAVGASAVAVATALGVSGVGVFGTIAEGFDRR